MIKLDLLPHLQHKEEALGQLLIIAEPTEKSYNKFNIHGNEYQYRNIVCSWVINLILSTPEIPLTENLGTSN